MKYVLTILLSVGLIHTFAHRVAAADTEPVTTEKTNPDGTWVLKTATKKGFYDKPSAYVAALEASRDALVEHLHGLENPVNYKPSLEMVKKLVKDVKYNEQSISSEVLDKIVNVEMTLEMPSYMEQHFRKATRVSSGLWGLGCAMAALLVIGAFFRLDEWSKGFLTTWLVLGAAGTITGLVVLGLLA